VPVCRLSPGRGRPYCWAKAQTLRPWQFGFPGVPAKTKKPLSVTSNTVPALFAPPSAVVPKRLPLASAIRGANGSALSAPLKLTSGIRLARLIRRGGHYCETDHGYQRRNHPAHRRTLPAFRFIYQEADRCGCKLKIFRRRCSRRRKKHLAHTEILMRMSAA
jgi:hypothetical protein